MKCRTILWCATLTAFDFAVSAPTIAAPVDTMHLDSASLSRVHAICAQVLRVNPGEAQFGACIDSLSAAAVAHFQRQNSAQVRTTCVAKGLIPGTPEAAECELQAPPPLMPMVQPAADPEPRSPTPYWKASNAEIFHREELSCARLGLTPGAPSFTNCVASLESALAAVDDPDG